MLDIIQNNPFRILGVYSDASAAEIKRNETKIRRFLEVGKAVTFPTDQLGNLPAPERTAESLDKALSEINLPQDKLYYALFWYAKNDAFGINNCVDAVIHSDWEQASNEYASFLYDTNKQVTIQNLVLGNVIYTEKDIVTFFIDGFYSIVQGRNFLNICKSCLQAKDMSIAKDKVIALPLSAINSALSSAKNADKSTPTKMLRVGKQLISSTKKPLKELKELLGSNDSQYQMTADSLAKQILQCGISYFNGSDDDDKIDKALEIQEYALSIAAGKLTKDRCHENVDILKKQKEQFGSKKDIEAIANLLHGLASRPKRISSAVSFVDECLPILARLKFSLGAQDELYIKISSAVANYALGFVIQIVNNDSESKSLAESAMNLINKIESLNVDLETRNRIKTNKGTLQMNIAHMPSTFQKIDEGTGGCLGSLGNILICLAICGIITLIATLCS